MSMKKQKKIMRQLIKVLLLILFSSSPAFAINAPSNFRVTDCTSNTLTWSWTDVLGENGYQIFDASNGAIKINGIAQDSIFTVESNLSPNTTYSRYIRAYTILSSGTDNCASNYSGYIDGTFKLGNTNTIQYYGSLLNEQRGFFKFDLTALPASLSATDVKLFAYTTVRLFGFGFLITSLRIEGCKQKCMESI